MVHGDSQLREEKAVYIGSLFKRFIFIGADAVAGVGVGAEQHRKPRGGRGLQFRGHLAGMRWIYAMVVVAGNEQYRRIFRAGLHVVVGRVGIERLKQRRVLDRPELGHVEAAIGIQLHAQHVVNAYF